MDKQVVIILCLFLVFLLRALQKCEMDTSESGECKGTLMMLPNTNILIAALLCVKASTITQSSESTQLQCNRKETVSKIQRPQSSNIFTNIDIFHSICSTSIGLTFPINSCCVPNHSLAPYSDKQEQSVIINREDCSLWQQVITILNICSIFKSRIRYITRQVSKKHETPIKF